jgi:hypothetical protein
LLGVCILRKTSWWWWRQSWVGCRWCRLRVRLGLWWRLSLWWRWWRYKSRRTWEGCAIWASQRLSRHCNSSLESGVLAELRRGQPWARYTSRRKLGRRWHARCEWLLVIIVGDSYRKRVKGVLIRRRCLFSMLDCLRSCWSGRVVSHRDKTGGGRWSFGG